MNSQKLDSRDFRQIEYIVLTKGKSAISPLFNGQDVLSSASDKTKFFANFFSKNFNLDDSGISLSVLPSRANLKLHNISVSSKIVKKVITTLNSSNSSIQVSRSLVFQIVGISHWWSLSLRMLEKGLHLKTANLLVFFLWLVKSLKTS